MRCCIWQCRTMCALTTRTSTHWQSVPTTLWPHQVHSNSPHSSSHLTLLIRCLTLTSACRELCSLYEVNIELPFTRMRRTAKPKPPPSIMPTTLKRSLNRHSAIPNLRSRISRQNYPALADLGPRSYRLSLRTQERNLEGRFLPGRPVSRIVLR
jgi:hypothetical protein